MPDDDQTASGTPSDSLREIVHRQLAALVAQPPTAETLTLALRLLAKWRSHVIENTLVRSGMAQVSGGPFVGMTYDLRASEGGFPARLLGAYEASLHPVIEGVIAARPARILDIGCAEGYYAVGLARRLPGTQVIARDADPRARALCAELARRNGVAARVEVGGLLTQADLHALTGPGTFVLCDIEGAEDDLLDPVRAPALRRTDILVEVHEGMVPGLTDRLTARFAPSHAVTRIGRTLAPDALPAMTEGWGDLDRLLALWEWRAAPTPWLWLQARDR